MKKIAMSLTTIAFVAMMAVGATGAYFTSTAYVNNNTFSTGTLELRVNGQPAVSGAVFTAVAPGELKTSGVYGINNYGQPWFAGPSNLTAKKLKLNVTNPNDFGSGLWQDVYVKVEVNRGWPTWEQVYSGKLKDLSNVNLFGTRWTELIPGSTEDFRYTVWLPDNHTNQNALMGKTLTWDWSIEGRTN